MKNVNYADMANNLLGDELYYKFITEIAKEGKGENLVDFGKMLFINSFIRNVECNKNG